MSLRVDWVCEKISNKDSWGFLHLESSELPADCHLLHLLCMHLAFMKHVSFARLKPLYLQCYGSVKMRMYFILLHLCEGTSFPMFSLNHAGQRVMKSVCVI